MKSVALALVLAAGISLVQCELPLLIRLPVNNNDTNPNSVMNEKVAADLVGYTTPEFIEYFDFPCETYHTKTQDGYILTLHRIPYPKGGAENDTRPTILLQHGLFGSSEDFVITGPHKSLAFYLSEAGYDVWLGNNRGGKYSRKHVSLNPNTDNSFWDFSYHEIGMYDLPAMIDFILNFKRVPKIFYAGHSQGTTSYYVMASERPEYNDKIIAHYSLAPIAFFNHAQSLPFLIGSNFNAIIELGLKLTDVHEITRDDSLLFGGISKFCDSLTFNELLCITSVSAAAGFDIQNFDRDLLPIILRIYPVSSSTKQVLHFAQGVTGRKFRQYDYGFFRNERVYGQRTPPEYNLSNIRSPVHLIYSCNDLVSACKDVMHLYESLGGEKSLLKVGHERWNHMDYLWGMNIDKYVGKVMLDSMQHYL